MHLGDKKITKQQMSKILSWLDETPSPNEGRIKELRDAIEKHRYPSKKIIDAVARELILRFEGRKRNSL